MPGLTYTIAELLKEQGSARANALREQAKLRADAQRANGSGWANAVAGAGQYIASIPAQKQQAQRQEAAAELETLKAQELRGEMADKATKRQQAEAFQSILNTHQSIDEAISDPKLMAADPARYSDLKKHVMDAQKAADDERARRDNFIASTLGSARDQGTWTKAKYTVGRAYPSEVQDLPDDFEEAKPVVQSKLRAALSPKDQLEQMQKEQIPKGFTNETQLYAAAADPSHPQHQVAMDALALKEKPAKGAAVGSFEDFILRKYGDNPTPDQIKQGRKEYMQADDRPRVNVSVSGAGASDVKETVAGMKDGTLPPQLPGRATKEYNAIMAEAHRQHFDLAQAATDWQATQKHVATLNGAQQTRMAQAIDNASHSLDVIENLANQWDGGKFPILNKVTLASAKNGVLGPKAQQLATKLDAQIADVTSELANVYMGGNSPTDHALDLAAKNLQANWTKDQLKAALDLSRKNLQIRSNSMKNVGVAGASAGNPYAPQQQAPVNPTMRFNPATGKVEPIK